MGPEFKVGRGDGWGVGWGLEKVIFFTMNPNL